MKDREGRFTLVNKAVADVYGTTISEIIGKTDAYFNDNEEEVAQFRADDIEVITSGCEKVIREERITDARGATRWLQTTKRPLALPDGTVQILGVSTDITERRALTEQLFQSQKMEAIGSLAGGIAHDFNNLLTAILGYVGFLKLRVGNEGEIADSVHKVEGIATKASQLTQKLLAFARKGKNQNISVDVHSLVNETIDILARTIESSVEIKLALDAKSAEVLGDPVQLQQVVLNLAINARDAMSPRVGGSSGGTLKIATRNITSERGFLSEGREYFSAGVAERERIPDGQYVEISVSDTGCGITESAMQRIFEPFFTTKGEGKGTGMGLAVVYGIVKNHGGIVTVKSTAGAGAHFKVYLPLEVRKSIDEVQSADVSEGSPIAGQGRILLVDDHSEIRDVTGQMLKHLGYRVVTASDGREAVEYMEGNSNVIDLVILDMTMPRLGGREAFKAIRKINPHVKTILSTGYLNTTYIEEILREGINGFMQKPYEMRRLSEVVAEVLR